MSNRWLARWKARCRSSPARPAASVSASPARWPLQAPRSCSTALASLGDRPMRDGVAGLVAHRQLDPRKPAHALRRADRDVGRAQAFAVGEGGVRHDADVDAERLQACGRRVAGIRSDQVGEDAGWRRRCGPSRSRCTTRSPSASIRPRKRSSLSCSSHMRSASVSNSARLRWRPLRVDARPPSRPSARRARRQDERRPRRLPRYADGDEDRRTAQIGTARRATRIATR